MVLFDSLVENLSSIVDLNSDLIYKNYLIVELIEVCRKNSNLNLKNLIQVNFAIFLKIFSI